MSYFFFFFLIRNIVYFVICDNQNSLNIYEILDGLMTPYNIFKKCAAVAETKTELKDLHLFMNYNR